MNAQMSGREGFCEDCYSAVPIVKLQYLSGGRADSGDGSPRHRLGVPGARHPDAAPFASLLAPPSFTQRDGWHLAMRSFRRPTTGSRRGRRSRPWPLQSSEARREEVGGSHGKRIASRGLP